MLSDELSAIAEPIVAMITRHPFWTGLRRGTLPSAALWYFAEQDARHVVPAYARALARCAAIADSDVDGALLASAASATFGSLSRLDGELEKLAAVLGQAPGAAVPGPPIHAYTSFMLASPASSFACGVGGLLPMTWFHLLVSDDLREWYEPGSRYGDWIDHYLPEGEYLQDYVRELLAMTDRLGERCGPAERARLIAQFRLGARYEWQFAEAAWQCRDWPV